MSSVAIGIIGIVVLLIMLFLRVPVALSMSLVGFVGYWLVGGMDQALRLLGIVPYSTLANYTFSVIPLFVLMGFFIYYGNMATGMFDSFNKWFGNIRGGICYATILGGAAFGAANGAGPASTATIARIAIPEMERLGVNKRLAYGVVASAGPLATMIPPSILMIIYGILTEQSVGKLLIAGIVPGIIIVIGYSITIFILTKINPNLAPKVERTTFKEKVRSLKGIWGLMILIASIMGGLYLGFFTPTEAGAFGALVALVITVLTRRLSFKGFKDSIYETIRTTAMIGFIIISSFLLGYFLGITQIPNHTAEFLTSLNVHPMVIMLAICAMYLILGMFIDMLSALFLTIPIIFPAVVQLGFDPIWFGVIVVFLAEVSLVTPPFGMSIFVIQGVIKDSKFGDIVKGSLPFIIADFVILFVLLFFPELVLFLPNFMDQ